MTYERFHTEHLCQFHEILGSFGSVSMHFRVFRRFQGVLEACTGFELNSMGFKVISEVFQDVLNWLQGSQVSFTRFRGISEAFQCDSWRFRAFQKTFRGLHRLLDEDQGVSDGFQGVPVRFEACQRNSQWIEGFTGFLVIF